MTEHEFIQARLALYVASALDPGETRRVEEHADRCEICRRELLVWSAYARGVSQLPQPAVPEGLMHRTRARIVEQREISASRRHESAMLAALVAFAWAASLTTWALMRVITGGALHVWRANLLSVATWPLLSTVFVWMTAAAAAAMLGRRDLLRRVYEPVS